MCKTFLAQAVPCTNCSACRTAGFGWSVPTLQHAGCLVSGTAQKGTILIQAQMFHRGREQEKSQYCQLRWEAAKKIEGWHIGDTVCCTGISQVMGRKGRELGRSGVGGPLGSCHSGSR